MNEGSLNCGKASWKINDCILKSLSRNVSQLKPLDGEWLLGKVRECVCDLSGTFFTSCSN